MVDLVNGTTVGITATLPATFDATGYSALTFTTIGEVIDVGELGRTHNIVSHDNLGDDFPTKLKASFDIGNLSLNIGNMATDAGQVLVNAAEASKASYSFKITLPSGTTKHFTAKVAKASMGALAKDGVETLVVDLAIDANSLV